MPVKSGKGSHLWHVTPDKDSVKYADNMKILRSKHRDTWNTLQRYFTELLLKTMYVPLSNTPELYENRPGNDKGPQSLVTFNVRSNGWIWWDSALRCRVISDESGYIPPFQSFPDSNVFVPLPEDRDFGPDNRIIEIFPHTGEEMDAIELLVLWNMYRPYDHFFPLNQHELIAPEIYYYLTKAIRSQREEKRQGASANELAIGLTSKIAGSRSIEDSQKMARTIQIHTENQMLHIPALINRGVWG